MSTGEAAEGAKWDIYYAENLETIGGDPIPLLIANIILPIFLLYPLLKVIRSPGLLIKGKVSDEEKEEQVELVKQDKNSNNNQQPVEAKVAS